MTTDPEVVCETLKALTFTVGLAYNERCCQKCGAPLVKGEPILQVRALFKTLNMHCLDGAFCAPCITGCMDELKDGLDKLLAELKVRAAGLDQYFVAKALDGKDRPKLTRLMKKLTEVKK